MRFPQTADKSKFGMILDAAVRARRRIYGLWAVNSSQNHSKFYVSAATLSVTSGNRILRFPFWTSFYFVLFIPGQKPCSAGVFCSWSRASPKRWKWTISRWRRNFITSLTSGSSDTRRMLSYTARAFCSAAKSSTRSAIGSPVTAMLFALYGMPVASAGNTPRPWFMKYAPKGLFSISLVVAFLTSWRTIVPTISRWANSFAP